MSKAHEGSWARQSTPGIGAQPERVSGIPGAKLDAIGLAVRDGRDLDSETRRWLRQDLELTAIASVAAVLNRGLASALSSLRVDPRDRSAIESALVARDKLDRFLVAALAALFPRGVFVDDEPTLNSVTALAREFDVELPLLLDRDVASSVLGSGHEPRWLEVAYQGSKEGQAN